MKKILTILLVLSMLTSLAACGNKNDVETNEIDNETIVETGKTDETVVDEKEEVVNQEKEEPAASKDKGDKKPTSTPTAKPENTPAATPTAKPEKTPEATPTPIAKPEPTPEAAKTLGNTLLADFKKKAASMGTEELANALITNPAIKFMGGAMTVEEGLLSGFDNAEIKGFKSGAVFMPMIGSIPFIGYVFELENAADVSGFISNLKKNANLRWNICVAADEMVTGSVGNKVFFVMCPTTLEE